MREKIKWLDPITQSTILFALMFIFVVTSIKTGNRAFICIAFIISCLACYRLYMATKEPGLLLESEFDAKMKIKFEEGCDPVEMYNSTELPIQVDGINTGIKSGKVYKIRSGTNVRVDKSGNIKEYSFISRWVNPGWVSKSYFSGDKCWEKLFD